MSYNILALKAYKSRYTYVLHLIYEAKCYNLICEEESDSMKSIIGFI